MSIPAAMLPKDDVTLGHFTVTINGKGEPNVKRHAIEFWSEYGFVCSLPITSNGNLHLIVSHIQRSSADAVRMAREYDCDSVDYTLTLLTGHGFQAVDIGTQSYDELKSLFLAGAEILQPKQEAARILRQQQLAGGQVVALACAPQEQLS